MRLFWALMLILVVVLARSDSSVYAASVGVPVLRWTGQDFTEKQGGAFTTFSLRGLDGIKGVDIEVILYSILDRAYYTMTFRSVEGIPLNERLIWVFRSGKYAIRAIRMEAGGKRYRWNTSKNNKSFLVQRGALSNLGEWVLEPEEGGRLQVKIRGVPSPFPSDHPPFQKRVAAVIDGFGGQVHVSYSS